MGMGRGMALINTETQGPAQLLLGGFTCLVPGVTVLKMPEPGKKTGSCTQGLDVNLGRWVCTAWGQG